MYSSRPLPPPLDSDELIFEEKYRKQQVCDCHHQSPDKDHIEQVDAILPREIFFDLAIDPFEKNFIKRLFEANSSISKLHIFLILFHSGASQGTSSNISRLFH